MITLDRIKAEASTLPKDAVNPRGRYDDEDTDESTCYYSKSDYDGSASEPGCIAGTLFSRIDRPLFDLLTESPELNESSSIASLHRNGYLDGYTAEAVEWLRVAQDWADNSATWGEAIEKADRLESWRG